MPAKPEPNFMSDFPVWGRMLLQMGFAGVIAFLFVIDSRDRSTQLREMQMETRSQMREDRTLFREEAAAQRQALAAAVNKMEQAIVLLTDRHMKLENRVEDIRNPIPKPHTKPE